MKERHLRLACVTIVAVLCALTAAGPAAEAGDPDVIVPASPVVTPTLNCIGIFWPVEGDEDGDAVCAVSYRRPGTAEWRSALPLHRKPPAVVDLEKSTAGPRPIRFLGGIARWNRSTQAYALAHWRANYLAGSIFHLEPSTEYEILLRLADPDTPQSFEELIRITTRGAPALNPPGRRIEVNGAEGAAGIAAALAEAQPGDTIALHAGTYAGPLRIAASGRPGRPIVICPAGDGPVIVQGKGFASGERTVIEITGSHIHVNGLEVRGAIEGISIGGGRHHSSRDWNLLERRRDIPSDVSVTRCRVYEVQHAIVGNANECYIADNELTGLAATVPGIDWSEGEGVEVTGSGTVVCHNRMRRLADGVSVYPDTSDQDVHNNDVSGCSDDGIELDYCDYNNRVWENAFNFAGNNGISFQPHIGGPGYIIRNQVVGFREGCIKDRYGSSDVYFFHNTFIGHAPIQYGEREYEVAPTDLPMRIVSRNNLYLLAEGTDWPVVDFHEHEVGLNGIDMDHDGLGGCLMVGSSNAGRSVDPAKYPGSHYVSGVGLYVPVAAFAKVSGALRNSVALDPAAVFSHTLPPWREWNEDGPAPVMKLKEGAAAIDAGVVIVNVGESFSGAAPDLGAIEYGAEGPILGPRPAGKAPYESASEETSAEGS